ncbi:hypothetical protein IFM89_011635 [Coptis chinensis]|uniref:Uncharacterized protein n=1 Tax=Coptis chinensis TaxID=261450 RepID=A0A835IXM8_9MAGN|nr:hypothetical protein IFM89_011635 [Coptis chinensis]
MNDDLPPIIPVMSDPQPPHTTNKSSLNISAPPPHISSYPPLQISSPPPPPLPRPIDDIEDDEGHRSTHSSEDEEEFEIANRLDFNDFIAMTDNVYDGDDGKYKLAYMSNVKPMKDVKDWLKPDPNKHVKPPLLVRGIGRPRKQRMRAEDENENGHIQKNRKMTCIKCKGI